MRLLIVTQVVDLDHPILGFFHRWIEEFATQCDTVHVICLQAGRHSLPANVTVQSLGKESGESRIKYLRRFYSYIFSLRHEHDNVFVHMNQIYVVLGGLLWRLWGKQIGLWYMHGSTSLSLRIATWLTHHVFTGSPESFRLKSKKVFVTGHGIDTKHFSPADGIEKDIDLITVGRISPSKNLITLVDILSELPEHYTLTIVGGAVTAADQQYQSEVQQKIAQLQLQDRVVWYGRVPQTELPDVLRRAKLFVTVAQNGSLDKAVLEPMACGLPVVSMAPGTKSLPLDEHQCDDAQAFVQQVERTLAGVDAPNHASYVHITHSLPALIGNICGTLQA